MKGTILCFIGIVACASAAAVVGKVKLVPEAQVISDAAESLTDSKRVAKMIQCLASHHPAIRTFISDINNISTPAQMCALGQVQVVQHKIQTNQTQPENAVDAILDACTPYKAQLEPAATALKAAIPEMHNSSMGFYHDMPQSVQDLMKATAEFGKEMRANPGMKNDTAVLGPKVTALINQYQAISEADREAVTQKLPYLKELILPSGQYYADFNNVFLVNLQAEANGQEYNKTALKEKAMELRTFAAKHLGDEMAYIDQKVDNCTVSDDVAKDSSITKMATKLGKLAQSGAKSLLKEPTFMNMLNGFVSGSPMPMPMYGHAENVAVEAGAELPVIV